MEEGLTMNMIHTDQQAEQALQDTKPVVFIWSTNWCPDCIYLNTFIDKIVAANPEFAFYKLNSDELPDLAEKQGILGIPSFTVFRNGKEIGRFVSKLRKTPEEIQAFLDECRTK